MELRQYWDLLRKWLWLITLTTVLAAAASYIVSNRQPPVYQASTRLRVVQGAANNPTVTYTDILLSERLSRTYAEMIGSRPVMQAVIDRVGLLDVDPDELAKAVSVTSVRDTQLIDLNVEHIVPSLAADIANALPVVFSEINQAQQTLRYQESRQSLEAQLAALDEQIRGVETNSDSLRGVVGADAESRRSMLENQLVQYRSSYGNVLAQLENIRLVEANALDTLSVIEPAVAPRNPIRPRVLMNTLLAAIVGGMLGLGAAFLVEYLDDTVKNPDDVSRLTGLSTLGIIARQENGATNGEIVAIEHPRSPVVEAYRTIRTGIQFSSIDKPLKTLVVTSPSPDEGKSTTAANLAVVMAQTGKRVVLIDADLRKPTQHKRWGVPNAVGLTGAILFEGESDNFDYLLEQTKIKNLWVVPSGQIPHNPSELLGSSKLKQFTESLLEEFDFIVLDTSPVLAVTDPAVLGRSMDGILLVVDAASTREPALVHAVSELEKVGGHIIGVALNNYAAKSDSYYYYYKQYYADDEGKTDGDDSRIAAKPRKRSRTQPEGLGQRLMRAVRRS